MCCGFTTLNMEQFMTIQRRLLLEQLDLLGRSALGARIMRGAKPRTVEEFRAEVPLTTYADYYPELAEKREDILPARPVTWVHTSGRSGEYPCKWVPLSRAFAEELSLINYGVGMLSSCRHYGDTSSLTGCPSIVYCAAPPPYMSGTLARLLSLQSPANYLPPLDEAEALSFEERTHLGFQLALSRGLDYFFGLSLVLVVVGERFSQSSGKIGLSPLLKQPKALFRLAGGVLKSKLARRHLLPRDIWQVKGIMCGGLDSWVYREKIKELWGRYPLDVYASTEAGVVACQTWDYQGMTFIPSLNFLEFIPEPEYLKSQLDSRYQPRTVLLDEVNPGEKYEIVTTNFHGGAMIRYRVGDMVRITSLGNDHLGINIPQMVFEHRADGLLDFVVIRLTEKMIWQAIENTGIAYTDWTAYKVPGEPVLRLLLETKNGFGGDEADISRAVHQQLMKLDNDSYTASGAHNDLADMINFRVETTLLPAGAFASYLARRRAEGADLAHLKPPHLNAPLDVLALLLGKSPEISGAGTPAGAEPAAKK